MRHRCYVLLRRRHDVPIRCRGDKPLRRLEHVPLRRRWVFHLRRTCNVVGMYRETSLRRSHDVLLPDGKECLSISLATQDNLEPILLLRSVDQHQKQKDEILEPPYIPHPWIWPGTFHYVTSLLSHFSHLCTSLPSHTFSTFPAHYPPHFPTFPAQYSPTFPSSPPSQRQIDHSKIATFLH